MKKLAARALEKRQAGGTPTVREQRALERWEAAREEEQRWYHYRTIPQKDWRKLSGCHARQLKDQAARYGIPFGGAIVDLCEVVPALRDFLDRNAHRLEGGDGDPLMSGPSSPALEKYRRERARMLQLERLEREGVLISADKMNDSFNRIANILRQAGETLEKGWGSGASKLLDEALDRFEASLDELLADDAGEAPAEPGDDSAA